MLSVVYTVTAKFFKLVHTHVYHQNLGNCHVDNFITFDMFSSDESFEVIGKRVRGRLRSFSGSAQVCKIRGAMDVFGSTERKVLVIHCDLLPCFISLLD